MIRERPLMRVGALDSVRRELIAPGIEISGEPASSGELPLSLGRQPRAGPARVRLRIRIGHMNHRMTIAAEEITGRPVWMLPVRARHVLPPLKRVTEVHPVIRRSEDR